MDHKHAIVVGGSIGGLLAARVLTSYFDQVTILDRDTFPEVGDHRRGVPQGRHAHGLLAGGRAALEELLPGLSDEMVAAGAIRADIVHRGRWFQAGGLLAQFPSDLDGVLISRPLIEGLIRRRVFALEKVAVRENCVVEDLAFSEDRQRVTGVRVGGETLGADLVVDATGRGSHSPQWLAAAGYDKPAEATVRVDIAYTTRCFYRKGSELNGDLAVILPPTPEGKRSGVLLALEGGRWICTLVGFFGISAPQDLPGFIEFSRTLPWPDIHEVLTRAEPLGDAAVARFPASLRRRYERLRRFPDGLLVFGDAISSFDPIYGQGMTVAAMEALQLDKSLAQGFASLARRFFERAGRVVDTPWEIAVGGDLRIPETEGPRSAKVSFINWYLDRMNRAGQRDPELALAFHRVANLLAPPPSILHPRVVARVLRAGLGRAPETRPRAQAAAGY